MHARIYTIARFTLLEALRTRLPLIALACVLVLLSASFFVREIAVTESTRMQTGFYAAALRLTAVFVTLLYVLSSIAREFNDKVLDVALAAELPRSHYILGKLAGFLVISVALAFALSLPLLGLTDVAAAGAWAFSLACELAIVSALAIFCIMTFNALMPAASFIVAFYLLCRSLGAIRLMSASPVSGGDTVSHQFMHQAIEALALVLPPLDEWTQTSWLTDGTMAWPSLPGVAAAAAIYVALLTAAAAFDFYRREF